MKIELVESTLVYNISVNEKDYTLYISETDNSYYNQELIDEDGNILAVYKYKLKARHHADALNRGEEYVPKPDSDYEFLG